MTGQDAVGSGHRTSDAPTDTGRLTSASPANEAGEPACYAHLVCPECGGVTTEGHRPDCGLAALAVPPE
jgi:hypothetical protein